MNQKSFYSVLRVLLAAVLLACACLPACAEEKPASQVLVTRIIQAFTAGSGRDAEAFSELAGINPALAEKWERILDIWEQPAAVNAELPDGLPDDGTLCLVGLGYQLNADGTMRKELVERLKVLLAASQKYPRAVIVCTGGPTAADNRNVSEAGRMSKWLIRNGVDPSRIIVEDRSRTTVQNAIFSLQLLAERCPQVTSLAIISSDYHISTGALLFGAEAILRGLPVSVVSNAAWHAPSGSLSSSFQGFALMELSFNAEKEYGIY